MFFSGSYPWAEQTLLLNCNQLQEKRARGENVVELAQKEMDWWTNFEEVRHTLENQRADCPGVYSSFHQLYGDNFSSVGAWDLIIIFFLLLIIHNVSSLVQEMLNLAIKYNKAVQEEDELPPEKLAIANVGRQDAKKHLEEHVSNLMSSNIVQTLGTMLDTVVF